MLLRTFFTERVLPFGKQAAPVVGFAFTGVGGVIAIGLPVMC
jgi:hypothetical protein